MERRLRSSSEGAGGPHIHGNQKDAAGMEGCGLLKHRNNSSSSKLGSLVGVELCVCVRVCVRVYMHTCVCFSHLAFDLTQPSHMVMVNILYNDLIAEQFRS